MAGRHPTTASSSRWTAATREEDDHRDHGVVNHESSRRDLMYRPEEQYRLLSHRHEDVSQGHDHRYEDHRGGGSDPSASPAPTAYRRPRPLYHHQRHHHPHAAHDPMGAAQPADAVYGAPLPDGRAVAGVVDDPYAASAAVPTLEDAQRELRPPVPPLPHPLGVGGVGGGGGGIGVGGNGGGWIDAPPPTPVEEEEADDDDDAGVGAGRRRYGRRDDGDAPSGGVGGMTSSTDYVSRLTLEQLRAVVSLLFRRNPEEARELVAEAVGFVGYLGTDGTTTTDRRRGRQGGGSGGDDGGRGTGGGGGSDGREGKDESTAASTPATPRKGKPASPGKSPSEEGPPSTTTSSAPAPAPAPPRPSSRPDVWLSRFADLKRFHRENGHCRVPTYYDRNPRLGRWIDNQRQAYRRLLCGQPSWLTDERVRLLKSIDFEWRGAPYELKDWSVWVEELREHKARHGTVRISDRDPVHGRLGKFLSRQRKAYKDYRESGKGAMTEERIAILEGLGMEWELVDRSNRLPWSERLEQLKRYKETHGNFDVPWKSKSGRSKKKKRLTTRDDDDDEGKQDEDDANADADEERLSLRDLGRWVYDQRTQYKRRLKGLPSPLTDERMARLTLIGFEWEPRTDDPSSGAAAASAVPWETRFEELKSYKAKFDTCHVVHSKRCTTYNALSKWYFHQRVDYKRWKRSKEEEEQEKGETEEGGNRSSSSASKRERTANERLVDERMEKLRELGLDETFDREKVKAAYWIRKESDRGDVLEDQTEEAEDDDDDRSPEPRKKRRKPAGEPRSDETDLSLSATTAANRKKGRSNGIYVPWEQRFLELRSYKSKFGTCHVDVAPDDPSYGPLRRWYFHQRKAYGKYKETGGAKGQISTERVELLDSIEFGEILELIRRKRPKKKGEEASGATTARKSERTGEARPGGMDGAAEQKEADDDAGEGMSDAAATKDAEEATAPKTARGGKTKKKPSSAKRTRKSARAKEKKIIPATVQVYP